MSKINTLLYENFNRFNDLLSLSSQVKAIVLEEYQRGENVQFVDTIEGSEFFDRADITLTYNKDLLNEFSYSLYATPVDKYDFITLVLRDIARGLGIASNIMADVPNKKLFFAEKISSYESYIYSIVGRDASQAYINATKGGLPINISNYGTLSLYAPPVFLNGISLNSFFPDPNKKITQLLTYEFGRGTVIRSIEDDYASLFKYGLGWEAMIYTGGSHADGNGVTAGNTGEVVPYGGTITGSMSSSLAETNPEDKAYTANKVYNNVGTYNNTSSFNIREYCKPYDCNYRPNAPIDEEGWTVALLKKDGTWDIVYDLPVIPSSLNVSMQNFNYHCNMDDYARTADGFLRCRVVYSQNEPDFLYGGTYRSMKTRYYVLDHLPQRTKMKFSGVMPTTSARALTNEYMRDIKIGIKD